MRLFAFGLGCLANAQTVDQRLDLLEETVKAQGYELSILRRVFKISFY
jgi:hypothetical protein